MIFKRLILKVALSTGTYLLNTRFNNLLNNYYDHTVWSKKTLEFVNACIFWSIIGRNMIFWHELEIGT